MVAVVEDLSAYFETPHICASCEAGLLTTDEVILIEVVYPVKVGNRIECYRVDDGEGGFEYDPIFVHLDCWEEFEETMGEILEDVPPTPDEYSIFECSICKSGIRSWETSCLISPGELRRSLRSPNGMPDLEFVQCLGVPKMLCASCTRRLNGEVFEMWEGGFSHNEECEEGTHIRCWRNGECHDVGSVCPKERHG